MNNTYVIRYGAMRFLGEFQGLRDQSHPRDQKVVVRSDRGQELGEVLCPATDRTAQFLENPLRGEVLRVASAEDLAVAVRLDEKQKDGLTVCRELIAKRRLQMDLVDVEAILGGERMVFYYLA